MFYFTLIFAFTATYNKLLSDMSSLPKNTAHLYVYKHSDWVRTACKNPAVLHASL